MTFRDPSRGRTDPPDHREHDPELIAAHAAGDLPPIHQALVERLVVECADCARLRLDLLAIEAATHALPAPPAPRAFTLTAEQADRLGRGAWLRRLVRPLAGRSGVGRPLATAFTTLGLVGLLLASMPGGLTQMASLADVRDQSEVAGPAASGAGDYGPTNATDGSGRGAEIEGGGAGGGAPGGSGEPKSGPDAAPEPVAAEPSTPSLPLALLSTGFLAAGLGLFWIRRRAPGRFG